MRAFMLSSYEEDGPESICFDATPEGSLAKAVSLKEDSITWRPSEAEVAAFWAMVKEPATKVNVAHNLTAGWGGWQLTILDSDAL